MHRIERAVSPRASPFTAIACVGFVVLSLMFWSGPRWLFTPGESSDGHHVFIDACESCHSPFSTATNDQCIACHKTDLANDLHPVRTFDDPRWASTLAVFDARRCSTCHLEHVRRSAGVTIAPDFCVECHDDVPDTRASHAGFAADSCGNAGCHNFHDASLLNEPALARELGRKEARPGSPVWGRKTIAAVAREPDFPDW